MKTNEKLNLTMLCDFYELTMGNGYFVDGIDGPASAILTSSSAMFRTAAALPSRRVWSR